MKRHLAKIELAIGLRDRLPIDRKATEPLTKSSYRATWFLPPPPPPRGEGLAMTLEEPYGSARIATLEKASYAPNDPDALLLAMRKVS